MKKLVLIAFILVPLLSLAQTAKIKIDVARSIGEIGKYVPVTREIDTKSNKVSFSFPPHSVTQIEIAVKPK